MEKIKNSDISTGVKVAYALVTIFISALIAIASVSYSSGQYTQRIDTLEQQVKDTTKLVTDVAVMKNDISYIKQYIEELRNESKNKPR